MQSAIQPNSKSLSDATQHTTAQESADGFGLVQRCSTPWFFLDLHGRVGCTPLRGADEAGGLNRHSPMMWVVYAVILAFVMGVTYVADESFKL